MTKSIDWKAIRNEQPPIGKPVWVYLARESMQEAYYTGTPYVFNDMHDLTTSKVTHWMFLPKEPNND